MAANLKSKQKTYFTGKLQAVSQNKQVETKGGLW